MSHPIHLILCAGTRIATRNDGQPHRRWTGMSAPREGELRVRLDEERDALLTIKRGERPWPDVSARAEAPWRLWPCANTLHNVAVRKHFDEAFASTQLPECPNYAWANEFLLKARREMANSEKNENA